MMLAEPVILDERGQLKVPEGMQLCSIYHPHIGSIQPDII